MRLTDQELHIVTSSFTQYFGERDQLWLFGSRVDNSKRGGDIDLYIETEETNSNAAYEKKMQFSVDLQLKLGLQKIDVALNILPLQRENVIYAVAKETGIRLV